MKREKLRQELRKSLKKNQFYYPQSINPFPSSVKGKENANGEIGNYMEYFKFRFLICIILFFCITVVDASVSLTDRAAVQTVMGQIREDKSIEHYVPKKDLWQQWMKYLQRKE